MIGYVSRVDTLDDSSRHTSTTDTMDDCSLQTTQVRSPFHLQTASLYTKECDDTNSSLLLRRQISHVQTPTSSQTVTRKQLNSQSDLQPPQYDQTHTNTFDSNTHHTIESQYSSTIITSYIQLSPPQKRPCIHCTIPSHAQQPLDCHLTDLYDLTTYASLQHFFTKIRRKHSTPSYCTSIFNEVGRTTLTNPEVSILDKNRKVYYY